MNERKVYKIDRDNVEFLERKGDLEFEGNKIIFQSKTIGYTKSQVGFDFVVFEAIDDLPSEIARIARLLK